MGQTLDREKVREIIEHARVALEMVANTHGLRLVRKSCTFTPHEMGVPFRFEMPREDAEGNVVSKEWADYQRLCSRYGLRPEWLGETFTIPGAGPVRVIGLKPRNRRYPVIVQAETGKKHKLATALLVRLAS